MAVARLTEELIAELHLGHEVFFESRGYGKDLQLVLFDETLTSFGIRVGKRSRTWFVLGPKYTRLVLGHWPQMSLAEARQKGAETKRLFERETTLQKFKAFQTRKRGQWKIERRQKAIRAIRAGMRWRQVAKYANISEAWALSLYLVERRKTNAKQEITP